MKRLSFLLLLGALPLLPPAAGSPPPIAPALLTRAWPAWWIAHPTASGTDYGVYHFRRDFDLAKRPAHFVIHVSADNRYRLFVNGTSVCFGPARGTLFHWRFATVDIAPWLRAGRNVLAAVVWNFGPLKPGAQVSLRTGFIVAGDSPAEQVVDTGSGWKVIQDEAYSPCAPAPGPIHQYMVVGPGDRVDGNRYPWGWQLPGYDDHAWLKPQRVALGFPAGAGTDVHWWLVPRDIPFMEERPQRLAAVRRAKGVTVDPAFLRGRAPLTVPPHTRATILFDQSFETNAYPRLRVSGGRGGRIRLIYGEALFGARGQKGNRNEVAGRRIDGESDLFLPDGGADRTFSTLWFRTYRYVQMTITTADDPLTVDDFHGDFTAYPFRERGSFSSDDPRLARIWKVGWRTARLCAYETYFDCPYYEQMQYVGDTRIQALVSLYVAGDDRLMRNAIELIDQSRLANGLTRSRVPAAVPQIIPPFSLFWINMVHDYWMNRNDPAFVAARLTGVHAVLGWFKAHVDPHTGMLGPLPYWNFVDWAKQWPWVDATHVGGQPPGAAEGGSSIITLQFAWTLQQAAQLFDAFGRTAEAAQDRALAERLCAATRARCWDSQRQLFADTPEHQSFSQHANVMAILSGCVTGGEARALARRITTEPGLIQCSQYFRFYLLRALKAAGLGNEYVSMLQPWTTMLDRGLTTFAETPDPTRSDCHGWSASPLYEFLATVCGIEPGSPGFKTVSIEPHLGYLHHVAGTVPHPAGDITVDLTRTDHALRGTVTLPPGLTGTFRWAGRAVPLHPGRQTVDVPAAPSPPRR